MIDARQLRFLVVRPALVDANIWSPAAENIVMGTAAQESRLTYLHQLGEGPAKGLWQMEPATHSDIWENFLRYDVNLANRIIRASSLLTTDASPFQVEDDALVFNLRYAALMCRAHYLRRPEALPDADDVEGMAAFYKKWYNTPLGAATEQEFIANYELVRS